MLEIIKYGTSKRGVWVIGTLQYQGLEVTDIFNTNLKDEEELKDKTSVKPKKFKISRRFDKIVFSLEF